MNQMIDESWRKYLQQTMFDSNPKYLESVPVMDMKTGEKSIGARQYHKNGFLSKCKADPEFSQIWGLKIEERELSLEEKAMWLQNNKDYDLIVGNLDHDHIREVVENEAPAKLITITYNNETIESYE